MASREKTHRPTDMERDTEMVRTVEENELRALTIGINLSNPVGRRL
jgi:hypothetical protein